MGVWLVAGLVWWLAGWKAAVGVFGVALAAELLTRVYRKGAEHAS